MKKYIVELIGTFWLVFCGCGSALFAATFPDYGIGFVGVSLAFGLSLLTMIYTIGTISGCHLNPAVSFAMVSANRMSLNEAFKYSFFQVLGAILAASVLYVIQSGSVHAEIAGFASNGYGENSPMEYDLLSCFLTEFVLTFFFLLIILSITSSNAYHKFSGIVIGFSLTLIHLVSIPITNASVNPARSLSQALFAHVSWPSEQLWLFWVAPILGGVLAGFTYKRFLQ
ncbi:MAG: aquaporin Z [Flavobacterium sp.]|uniref:aquaporin Z n=1 Tax=Flavobacterium sp. TaxID=239 RepID=UPI0025BC6734|nr:aquaporin Z [Flavobacterium sp.]MCK6607397.1 aquaporin Z [Flavobacterium sp.]